MNMLWPGFLYLLGLIPLIIAAYIWILRRRRRFAVRYSSLSLVREALPKQSNWRRHLPFGLFLLALASLIIALGRPYATVEVPYSKTTVMLAVDVSLSMCSTDIQPTRLQAAQDAAISFIKNQKSNTQIGIVAFAGFAELIQPPTADQSKLESAIKHLATGHRTAIGSAILESVDAIAEQDQTIPPTTVDVVPQDNTNILPFDTVSPHIIVLLTDGASNAGPLPLDAAQQAADRGIRIYTIGFGTERGAPFTLCGEQLPGSDMFDFQQFGGFGGGGGFGGRFRRGIDEQTLKQIADMTGGEYYLATSANELQKVFQELPIHLVTRQETTEISAFFTGLGALLIALAIFLSLLWHPLS